VPLTPAEKEARKKKMEENYDKAMDQIANGGGHTGEVQEHKPWSLSTSYFSLAEK